MSLGVGWLRVGVFWGLRSESGLQRWLSLEDRVEDRGVFFATWPGLRGGCFGGSEVCVSLFVTHKMLVGLKCA